MSIGEVGNQAAGEVDANTRRPRRRTYALAAAGVAAAAAVAAGVAVALPSAGAGPSPISALTIALAQTSMHSYTFRLTSTEQFARRTLNAEVVSGAVNPRSDLGTELLTAHSNGTTQRAQVRFIKADLYTSVSPAAGFADRWDKTPAAAGAATAMPSGDLYGFASDRPVSPAALITVMRVAGATVRDVGAASGPGWTGTEYTFKAPLAGGRETVSGTVYVDQHGLVRRLATVTTERGLEPIAGANLITDRTITFADFGAPVQVNAPPNSQTRTTSGPPYWGFYF
jgi:hypothetical protein